MKKHNNKYHNGKIYKLTSYQTTNIYIGSTIQSLSSRLAQHKSQCKRYLNNLGSHRTSYELIKYSDCQITLLENYSCESKEQLLAKERYYIEISECVNKIIPGRTKKEYYEIHKEYYENYRETHKEKQINYCKQYREVNKEILREKKREYHKINKEKIAEKRNQLYTCECGISGRLGDLQRHKQSKRHNKLLQVVTPCSIFYD
jgi:hypothetical protein